MSSEIVINDEDIKVVVDEGKMCRETKYAVDTVLLPIENPVKAFGTKYVGSTCLVTVQSLPGMLLYIFFFFTS